ncbi:MAG TPA: 16S rRNA (cytosine(967)-C(5))-methyltransferase RsmB [Clostridia bacterium]|nr:16S rRNA (cytosine(967)-C(5))-methyltransferase RsmB [Clostridia bacterium]
MSKHSSRGGTNRQRRGKRQDARGLAVETLIDILEDGAYANIAVHDRLQQTQLSGPERGLFTELVYGVARTRQTLDWALSRFLNRRLDSLTPAVRNILRLGAYQLMYLERVPPRAAIHEAVELAKVYGHQGVAGLVNGVLRSLLRNLNRLPFPSLAAEPVKHIALKYSHPEWLVERWLAAYGQEGTIRLCEYNNRPAPLTVRVNTLKTTKEELRRRLVAKGMEVANSRYVPEALLVENWPGLEQVEEFAQGLFTMQDESSMLVAHALKPAGDALVVDACAAPGTKTTHLAELMQDRGKILAFDIHAHKLPLIKQACRRLGITSVDTHLGDARELPRLVPRPPSYILVDAPCSGLGVLGRRADARWRKQPEQLRELPELQLAILTAGGKALAPGGVMVYSTCSISPEENQVVVRRFLAENPGFVLENLQPYVPFTPEREEDRQLMGEGMLQLLPHVHGVDGFFMARLRKLT